MILFISQLLFFYLDSELYLLQIHPIVSQQAIDLCSDLDWSWKRFARGTGLFSEIDINNIDEEETDLYEKCHKMLMQWQEKSISAVTLQDFQLVRTMDGKGSISGCILIHLL